jgi:hypothetical protein
MDVVGNQGFYKEQKNILIVLLATMIVCWIINFSLDVTTNSMLGDPNQVVCEEETMVIF